MNKGVVGFRLFAVALTVFIITSSLLIQYTVGAYDTLTVSDFVRGLVIGIEWGSILAMIIGAVMMVFQKKS
ncbi:MAG: hypothetical protein FWG40_08960 [Peptococcaceae bacterium]|nr:hypothetical protein [Peptococcaceae bacterium]